MPQEISLFNDAAPLSLELLLFNLGIGVVLAIILRWHFRRFGSTLSNREEFAQVFPFVLLTTVLIISVVKSSLALSLGLVGALSIVRFRTPIKEPEELAYLFIAIAMGLGLGANQTTATVVAGLAILVVMAFLNKRSADRANKNLFLSVDWKPQREESPENFLSRLNEVIVKHVRDSDLRRFDSRDELIEATYLLDLSSTEDLSGLIDEIRGTFQNIGVSFIDQNRMPSL
jgi:hypothetical protein